MTTVLLVTFSKSQRIHSRQYAKLWRHRSMGRSYPSVLHLKVESFAQKTHTYVYMSNSNQFSTLNHKWNHLAINYLRSFRSCWTGVLLAIMRFEQHIFQCQQYCNLLSPRQHSEVLYTSRIQSIIHHIQQLTHSTEMVHPSKTASFDIVITIALNEHAPLP